MLPKKNRLTRKDIELFFKQKNKIFRNKLLILRFRAQNTTGWAFIVSSAIKKNAVARNTARRRMNEVISRLKDIKLKGRYVFMLRLNTKKTPSFKELYNAMIDLLKQCGAL